MRVVVFGTMCCLLLILLFSSIADRLLPSVQAQPAASPTIVMQSRDYRVWKFYDGEFVCFITDRVERTSVPPPISCVRK